MTFAEVKKGRQKIENLDRDLSESNANLLERMVDLMTTLSKSDEKIENLEKESQKRTTKLEAEMEEVKKGRQKIENLEMDLLESQKRTTKVEAELTQSNGKLAILEKKLLELDAKIDSKGKHYYPSDGSGNFKSKMFS